MDTIQKLALFVPPINENFDPNSVPLSGEEYLQRVIFERQNCPEIVSVKKPQHFENLEASETTGVKYSPLIEYLKIDFNHMNFF